MVTEVLKSRNTTDGDNTTYDLVMETYRQKAHLNVKLGDALCDSFICLQ